MSTETESIRGYARVMARLRVQREVNRPFLSRPHLKFGQCCVIWGYSFQQGAILSAKYSANLDAFGHAFLGMHGPTGAVAEFLAEVAKPIVTDFALESMKFTDYVGALVARRAGYQGDWHEFRLEHLMEKLSPEIAEERVWRFSTDGVALGANYPHSVRRMLDQTHAAVPNEDWALMRTHGLDIPPEQDPLSYEDVEKEESKAFMDYCQECCPDLYTILMK